MEPEGLKQCVLCDQWFLGWGNNPEPLAPYEAGQCCDECNATRVIAARIKAMRGGDNE